MTDQQTYRYQPDMVSHPGETLKRTIEALGLSQKEVARRTGQTPKHISEIVNGKARISSEAALAFERVLDVSASFWNARQAKFDEAVARQKERQALESHVDWLENFPIRDMVERKLIEPTKDRVEQLRRLLEFFGVTGPAEWNEEWSTVAVSFRQSDAYDSSKYAVAAWLRAGELEGRKMDCALYDEKAFRKALETVRCATTEDLAEFCRIARREFAGAGVALVFTPELPEARVHGATRWLSPRRALIQLSFRYKRDDIFFFTLFHEAAHVLLHSKREIFLENKDEQDSEDEQEREADAFSANFLIPPEKYAQFLKSHNLQYLSHDKIMAFADALEIAPGIVVGRLHHDEYVPPTHFRRHIRRLNRKVLDEFG